MFQIHSCWREDMEVGDNLRRFSKTEFCGYEESVDLVVKPLLGEAYQSIIYYIIRL